MSYSREVKQVMKEYQKQHSYSKNSVKFMIENCEKFSSETNQKNVLSNLNNIITNDEKRSDTAVKIFNSFCNVDFCRYFDDISGTNYVDVNITTDIPKEIEKKLDEVSENLNSHQSNKDAKQELVDDLMLGLK